ncbi:MAG: transglycosylase SLT domain-containing protein [Deltaproteobacteria bacterium]|nr:transglycosylase SLT domain-containing protein [Deltaproteobacteria bacterium]MBW1952240.1 transglycosylase SLT domain-containing protein [Deltaproteobacteria bacterium]MBW1985838.1 transglycosylase SLT domain-containing protein [Deltaproteobacteria bacterium]MBW2133844.1 transglycosylase SLT domain-containing protein [Deltaproteobacteria bacterium]
MKRLGYLAVAILWLLAGCSGNRNYVPDQSSSAQTCPVDQFYSDLEDEGEEPLAGDLSDQQLDELYAKYPIPGLENNLAEELKKWGLQTKYDMPIHLNKQVRNYIAYFCTKRKEVFRRYLARSTRYLPMIKKIFNEYGLPEDLAYLAMIESGFNNRAYSHAHACGMWQFIRATGRRYGLMINRYVDERRDPEKATRAAAHYLLDLYKRFGSWYLAAASYNCGEGRVQREIDKNAHLKNFWDLSSDNCLPSETKNYVPQMIAATIIAKNPKKYGFDNICYLPPLKYEIVKVKKPTSLKLAAIATGDDYKQLCALNPELKRGTTPPNYSAYLLKVPYGKKEAFVRNIEVARAHTPKRTYWARRTGHKVRGVQTKGRSKASLRYRVKRGDTVNRIARRYRTSPAKILALNGLRRGRDIKRGQILLVPGKQARSASNKRYRSVASKGHRSVLSKRSRSVAAKASRSTSTKSTTVAKRQQTKKSGPVVASIFPSWQQKPVTRYNSKKVSQAKRATSKKVDSSNIQKIKKATPKVVRKVSSGSKPAENQKKSTVRLVRKARVLARAK